MTYINYHIHQPWHTSSFTSLVYHHLYHASLRRIYMTLVYHHLYDAWHLSHDTWHITCILCIYHAWALHVSRPHATKNALSGLALMNRLSSDCFIHLNLPQSMSLHDYLSISLGTSSYENSNSNETILHSKVLVSLRLLAHLGTFAFINKFEHRGRWRPEHVWALRNLEAHWRSEPVNRPQT